MGPAFLATALGMIVFCSGLADPVSGYNHSSSFWAVAAGLAGSLLLDAQSSKSASLRGSICGACACLSFLTKQTTGFGVTMVIVFVIALAAWEKGGFGRAVRLVLPYAATFLYFTWRWLRGQLSELDAQFWLISGISFAAAYMHSLSFVTTESMVLPGGAVILAWGLDRIGNGRLASGWALPFSALRLAGIFCAAMLKLTTPFSWYGWKDEPGEPGIPVLQPVAASRDPYVCASGGVRGCRI